MQQKPKKFAAGDAKPAPESLQACPEARRSVGHLGLLPLFDTLYNGLLTPLAAGRLPDNAEMLQNTLQKGGCKNRWMPWETAPLGCEIRIEVIGGSTSNVVTSGVMQR